MDAVIDAAVPRQQVLATPLKECRDRGPYSAGFVAMVRLGFLGRQMKLDPFIKPLVLHRFGR